MGRDLALPVTNLSLNRKIPQGMSWEPTRSEGFLSAEPGVCLERGWVWPRKEQTTKGVCCLNNNGEIC